MGRSVVTRRVLDSKKWALNRTKLTWSEEEPERVEEGGDNHKCKAGAGSGRVKLSVGARGRVFCG